MKIRQLIAGGITFISVLAASVTAAFAEQDPNVYEVAYIYADALLVREEPFIGSKVIDQVYAGQEIEVVEECGDWAKVCLSLDSYGYINAYHFTYKTYYADEEVTASYADYDYSYDNYLYDDYNYEEQYYPTPTEDYSSYNYNYETPAETAITTADTSTAYTDTSTQTTTDTSTAATTSQTEAATVQATSTNSNGQYLSDYAKQYIGNPYIYGGTSLATGADCSGFTKAVLNANGIQVNGRTAADQAAGGTQIPLDQAQAGDLIYYNNGSGVYHIAIYNGDGTVTHSSNSTSGVKVSDLNYSGNAAGAVRYW